MRRTEEAQAAAAPESTLGGGAGASARGALTERQHGLDGSVVLAPERDFLRDAEQDQQPQLELARDERRQLDQERARAGHAMEVEAGRLERFVARLGERLDRGLRADGVEVALGRERHDDRRDVHADGEAIGGVAAAPSLERHDPGAVGRLEEGVDARVGLGEELAMRALEPSRHVGRCGGTRSDLPSEGTVSIGVGGEVDASSVEPTLFGVSGSAASPIRLLIS